jgi:CheY-like chemotaxis protein
MSAKRVLNVGQCAADNWSIARTLEKHFRAEVVPASDAAEALDRLERESFDLVLVNRVLDADGSSGLDVIKRVRGEDALRGAPVMLVSNYEDAQREAAAAGAVPGFGKAALGHPRMLDRVAKYLG